jgi:uroporphyrinogen-III synthase
MSVRVAVTRALPEAEATAARLRGRGFEPVLAPLLVIEHRAFDANVEGVQALLFTSANGVRAFAAATDTRAPRVLCVGDATAAAALAAGFSDVCSADGDVGALAALAQAKLDPMCGRLLHVSGTHVAGDLQGALDAAGFVNERRVVYEARAVTSLPPAFEHSPEIVLFHSARAAETFVRLGSPHAETMIAACLSQAVAVSAAPAHWKALIVAPAPREDALLDAIAAATTGG